MTLVVPSFLVPGSWLENLRRAEGESWIEGVELLFFSYDDDARAMLRRERAAIAALADRFSFSLHMPEPLRPNDEELVALSRPFVDTYIVHPPQSPAASDAWADCMNLFISRYSNDFLLEYTGASAYENAESLGLGLPLCADTGKLLTEGRNPLGWIDARAERIREIHLHGLKEPGKVGAGPADHGPLLPQDQWLLKLIPFLKKYKGRVNLEIFNMEGAKNSAQVLQKLLSC